MGSSNLHEELVASHSKCDSVSPAIPSGWLGFIFDDAIDSSSFSTLSHKLLSFIQATHGDAAAKAALQDIDHTLEVTAVWNVYYFGWDYLSNFSDEPSHPTLF